MPNTPPFYPRGVAWLVTSRLAAVETARFRRETALIAQLKHAANEKVLEADERKAKSRIMQRILVNDAEVRNLTEPWLEDLEQMLYGGRPRTFH